MQQNLPRFAGCIPESNCSEKCPGVGCRSSVNMNKQTNMNDE